MCACITIHFLFTLFVWQEGRNLLGKRITALRPQLISRCWCTASQEQTYYANFSLFSRGGNRGFEVRADHPCHSETLQVLRQSSEPGASGRAGSSPHPSLAFRSCGEARWRSWRKSDWRFEDLDKELGLAREPQLFYAHFPATLFLSLISLWDRDEMLLEEISYLLPQFSKTT